MMWPYRGKERARPSMDTSGTFDCARKAWLDETFLIASTSGKFG